MRAFGSFPVAGSDQDFAVALALFAASASLTVRAAGQGSLRLPVTSARVPNPAPMRTSARPSTCATLLRC